MLDHRKVRRVCAPVVLASLVVLLLPSFASGQATVNPTRALFNASSDHNATDGGGTLIVQSYQLGFYLVGASQPFQSVSLGKPTPDGTGVINVDLTTVFMGWPVPGTNYTADVAAVGPGGTARSALSNNFSFTGGTACTFTLSAASQNVPASGSPLSTTVSTASGCAWTGVSNATSWITVTSGSSGTGNGTVAYSITANTATTPRTGTLTIAGQTVTVTQAAACSFTLAPISQDVSAAAGSQTAAVTTTSGCTWTGVSNATSWLTVTSGSTGTGSGTVTYGWTQRTSSLSRTGTLTIAGRTLTVTQSGSSSCAFTLSSASPTSPAAGGPLSTTVTTTSGCAWTGVSNVNWITVTSGGSATGGGTISYTVGANNSTNPRTGTLTVAGQTVTVSQVGKVPGSPKNIRVTN